MMKKKTQEHLIALLENEISIKRGVIKDRERHEKLCEANLKIDPDWYNKNHDDTYEDYMTWSNNKKKELKKQIREIEEMIDEIIWE